MVENCKKCLFKGTLFIKKKESRELLPQNNHRNGSRPKGFNKNIDSSISALPKAKNVRHKPKVDSVCFDDTHGHINIMENANDYTHIIDVHEEHNRYDDEWE